MIVYREKTRDFCLVNPITKYGLHFPNVPFHVNPGIGVKDILAFSPSIHGYVFVVINGYDYQIWISIEVKKEWNHEYTNFHIHDLHAFMGKIYTLIVDFS